MKTIYITFGLFLFSFITEVQNNRHYYGPRTSPTPNNGRFYNYQGSRQGFRINGPRTYTRYCPPRIQYVVPIIPVIRVTATSLHYHWVPIYEKFPSGEEDFLYYEQRECYRIH